MNITLDAADTAAALAAFQTGTPFVITVTPTAPVVAPVPTPPVEQPFTLPPGAYPIYIDGVQDNPGDWSFGSPSVNYKCTTAPLDGPYCIEFTSKSAFSGYLPYFKLDANGIPDVPLGDLKYLNIAIKGSKDPQKWQTWFESDIREADGSTGEAPCGVGIPDLTPYAVPGQLIKAGLWVLYRVPLGEGGYEIPAGTLLRKVGIQDDTGDATNVWYMDRFYLSA